MKFRIFHTVVTILFLIWAVGATVMLVHNPLPIPDKGHRAFGVRDEHARETVVKLLTDVGGMSEHFTFDSGVTHQTILWDGFTSINYVDAEVREGLHLPGNAISVPVDNPLASAQKAVELLQAAGYEAHIAEGVNVDLPPNNLVLVESNAFDQWLMVFRLSMIKMPMPQFRK